MNYRRLGHSGLKVSELSLGSWVTYGNQVDLGAARTIMAAAFDAGINFFDNAEIYAKGASEEIMGAALKALGWRRIDYVVSTKFYWGMRTGPNNHNTLNRKYLLDAIDGSLKRLQLDHVDLVYCHRPDPDTPVEETVWAMHDIISRGRALYWGTSEWSAEQIRAAWQVADRRNLHKPVMEQPQYNLFHRQRVEREYAPLVADIGLGPADRQVPQRRAGRLARRGGELQLPARRPDRRRAQCAGGQAGARGAGARLHAGAAGARLVPEEPACQQRDHRRHPRRTAAREPACR
jgi:aryl-alcohol dehydrogenase-like predicted oxidoreductase